MCGSPGRPQTLDVSPAQERWREAWGWAAIQGQAPGTAAGCARRARGPGPGAVPPGRAGPGPPLNRAVGSPAQGREARRAQGAVWSVEDGESLMPENVQGRDVLGIASLGRESVEMRLLGETFEFSA